MVADGTKVGRNSSPVVTTSIARPATNLQLSGVAHERNQDDKQVAGHNLQPAARKPVLKGGPPPPPPPQCGPRGAAARLAKGSLTWRREQPPRRQQQGQNQPSARQEMENETEAADGPAATAFASDSKAIVRQDLLVPAVGAAGAMPQDRPNKAEKGTAESSPTGAEGDVANASPNDGRASEPSQAQPCREPFSTRDPSIPGGSESANIAAPSVFPPKEQRALTSSDLAGLVRVGHHKLERLDKHNAGPTAAERRSMNRGLVAVTAKASPSLLSRSSHQPPSRTYRKREMSQAPPPSSRQSAGKRIKLGPDATPAPAEQLSSSSAATTESAENSGKTYTDHCYRISSQSQHKKLVKVQIDASITPVCPHFARGVSCLDPRCRLRHDVSLEASRPFCRYFQHRGQCLREDCPFRHVKVNPNATPCPTFALLGYCDDPRCVLMHLAGSGAAKSAAAAAPAGSKTTATGSSARSYRRPPSVVENS